jgi:protein-disulfide isomerase
MRTSGAVTEQTALQAARNKALAAELGINGTPGFVIGQEIVPGAIDRGTLEGLIAKARSQAPATSP